MKVALREEKTHTQNILQDFVLKQAGNILLDGINAILNILGTNIAVVNNTVELLISSVEFSFKCELK